MNEKVDQDVVYVIKGGITRKSFIIVSIFVLLTIIVVFCIQYKEDGEIDASVIPGIIGLPFGILILFSILTNSQNKIIVAKDKIIYSKKEVNIDEITKVWTIIAGPPLGVSLYLFGREGVLARFNMNLFSPKELQNLINIIIEKNPMVKTNELTQKIKTGDFRDIHSLEAAIMGSQFFSRFFKR